MKKESVAITDAPILLFSYAVVNYMSAIETLICDKEMSLIRYTSFGFA